MTVVVDTSAVLAVLHGEPGSDELARVLATESCVMSAATWVELTMVVESRAGAAGALLLEELRDRTGLHLEPVDEELATEAIRAWRHYGRGRHAAGLNFGDVFSYALAQRLGAPLLYVGDA